jgi:hypothetical protein
MGRKKRAVKDMVAVFEVHLGHKMHWYSGGHKNNFGILKRVSYDEGSNCVHLWFDQGNKFLTKVWYDQPQGCECLKKEE